MSMEREKMPFASPRSEALREKPVRVMNIMERAGLERLQNMQGEVLTAEQAIEIDNRALRGAHAPNVAFGRPHGGEYVPQDLVSRMNDNAVPGLTLIDRGTYRIFESEHIPSVATKMSRFVVDPNRHPVPGEKLRPSRVPGEVLWKKGVTGEPLYREGKEPDAAEIRELTEQFYIPYYNGLLSVVGSLLDRREHADERVLVIDGHSFPVEGPIADTVLQYMREHYDPNMTLEQFPMFILGDIDGSGCDEDVRKKFRETLEKNFAELDPDLQKELMGNITGGLVLENFQFKGVHNVDFWSGFDGSEAIGRKAHNVNALQIECNETAYTNVSGTYDRERLEIIQKLMEKTALEVSGYLKQPRQA